MPAALGRTGRRIESANHKRPSLTDSGCAGIL